MHPYLTSDYLSWHQIVHFSDEDNIKLKEIMPDIIQAVTLMVQGDVDKAMNDFNAKKQV